MYIAWIRLCRRLDRRAYTPWISSFCFSSMNISLSLDVHRQNRNEVLHFLLLLLLFLQTKCLIIVCTWKKTLLLLLLLLLLELSPMTRRKPNLNCVSSIFVCVCEHERRNDVRSPSSMRVFVVVLLEITRKEIMIICFLLRLCSVFHSTFIFCSIRMNKSQTCSYTLLCLGWEHCTHQLSGIAIKAMSAFTGRIVWPISFVTNFWPECQKNLSSQELFLLNLTSRFHQCNGEDIQSARSGRLSLDCDLCTELNVSWRSRSNEWISEHPWMFNEKSTFTLPPCCTIVIYFKIIERSRWFSASAGRREEN